MLIWTSRNIPNVGLFSAYAEVFLRVYKLRPNRFTFLCLRRGVSLNKQIAKNVSNFSLPTQRCFRQHPEPKRNYRLFSAYAEVFPGRVWSMTGDAAFLCLRRGVSDFGDVVTVWLAAFLCLRRGVSREHDLHLFDSRFSLPTQRCF